MGSIVASEGEYEGVKTEDGCKGLTTMIMSLAVADITCAGAWLEIATAWFSVPEG